MLTGSYARGMDAVVAIAMLKTESMAKKLKLIVAHGLEAFEVKIRLVANFMSISVARAENASLAREPATRMRRQTSKHESRRGWEEIHSRLPDFVSGEMSSLHQLPKVMQSSQ